MTALRKAFVAAIVKSLLRGKSLIQAILAFWVAPVSRQPKSAPTVEDAKANGRKRAIQDFLKEAEEQLLGPIAGDALTVLSTALRAQFRRGLESNPACMLPSFNHQLPTGRESGRYVALDVGGSTLRVAMVELTPSFEAGADASAVKVDGDSGLETESQKSQSRIVRMLSFKIDQEIKDLKGMAFFDWMAARIFETVSDSLDMMATDSSGLPMSLSWSFPVE